MQFAGIRRRCFCSTPASHPSFGPSILVMAAFSTHRQLRWGYLLAQHRVSLPLTKARQNQLHGPLLYLLRLAKKSMEKISLLSAWPIS